MTVKLNKALKLGLSLAFLLAAGAVDANEPITPLPSQPVAVSSELSGLGDQLFHEPMLSKNNTISCASCHDLRRGGVDGRVRSIGIDGQEGDINAPTVYNTVFNFRQFWNGRRRTLEDQVGGPIEHPKEMGSTWKDVVTKLNSGRYRSLFEKVFPDGVTEKNVRIAIAAFERTLVTPNSRFDQFLRGKVDALTAQEKAGYQRFKSFGCVACHQGVNVGGNMFQSMGVMGNYFKDRGTPITDADLGVFTESKQASDKFVFKVPSLRNIALTAPYFHDGSAKTLRQAVAVMAKYQLGRKLSESEIDSIVSFLQTLTGDVPESVRRGDKVADR